MALSGTLKDFGIADILQLIGQQQKSGILQIESPDGQVDVTFNDGNVAAAIEKKRDKSNLLGSLLLRAEMITPEQLEEALNEQSRTLKRLGDILVNRALLSEMQLSQLARMQATETLYRLFHWKQGTYEFTQGPVEPGKSSFEPLKAQAILLEGFRRMDEWPLVRKRIPSNQCTFERKNDLPLDDEDPGSTDVGLAPLDAGGSSQAPGERHKLLFKLAVPGRTAEKLIDLSRLGEFEALKGLEQLVEWGFLKVVQPPRGTRIRQFTKSGPSIDGRAAAIQIGVTCASLLGALAIARAFMPALSADQEVPVRAHAAVRLLAHDQLQRLESALEVYRLENGDYPESLEKLVEGQLVAGVDLRWPFRAPYHYKRTAQGFVLLPPLD
jgi:hypothetical protein